MDGSTSSVAQSQHLKKIESKGNEGLAQGLGETGEGTSGVGK